MSDLKPELMKKARACKSVEEFDELCATEGITLSDEQLEGVAGGDRNEPRCPTACGIHFSPKPCPKAKF